MFSKDSEQHFPSHVLFLHDRDSSPLIGSDTVTSELVLKNDTASTDSLGTCTLGALSCYVNRVYSRCHAVRKSKLARAERKHGEALGLHEERDSCFSISDLTVTTAEAGARITQLNPS